MFSDDHTKTLSRPLSGSADEFVVRLFDGFDFAWYDIDGPMDRESADAVCLEKNGGTPKTYDDIDYYAVFPADTKMVFSGE